MQTELKSVSILGIKKEKKLNIKNIFIRLRQNHSLRKNISILYEFFQRCKSNFNGFEKICENESKSFNINCKQIQIILMCDCLDRIYGIKRWMSLLNEEEFLI